MGAQNNRLIVTILLSTRMICFGREIRKLLFCYTLLTSGLLMEKECFCCLLLTFFQIDSYKKKSIRNTISVKWFGSRSGPMLSQSWSGSKPFAKVISRRQLEDLTVLKRSPDLLNNVKIGQDQLQLIIKHILFYGGCSHFGKVT